MSQISVLNGVSYLKERTSKDYRCVSVIAAPATQAAEVVVLEQLNSRLQSFQDSVTELLNAEENARSVSDSDILNLITNQYNQLSSQYQGILSSVTTQTRVTSIGELNAPIEGIDYNNPTDNFSRWILVDELGGADNGIYFQRPIPNTNLYEAVRVPGLSTVQDFKAGLSVFVNSTNEIYRIQEPATLINGKIRVVFQPGQRPESLSIDESANSQFLAKVGQKLKADLDNDYLVVLNGKLTLSDAVKAWSTTLTNAVNNITAIQGRLETLESTVATQAGTIATIGNAVSAIDSTVAGHSSSIAQTNVSVTNLTNKVADYDQVKADVLAQGSELESHDQHLARLDSELDLTDASVAEAKLLLQSHESRIQDNTNLSQLLSTSLTDARTTIAAHGDSLLGLNTKTNRHESLIDQVTSEVATKVDASQLFTSFISLMKMCNVTLNLTNADYRFENGWCFSTFRVDISQYIQYLGGNVQYRVVAYNAAAQPYTAVSRPLEHYEGNEIVIEFQSHCIDGNDNGMVPNNQIAITIVPVWFSEDVPGGNGSSSSSSQGN